MDGGLALHQPMLPAIKLTFRAEFLIVADHSGIQPGKKASSILHPEAGDWDALDSGSSMSPPTGPNVLYFVKTVRWLVTLPFFGCERTSVQIAIRNGQVGSRIRRQQRQAYTSNAGGWR
jgi:hypothetical protein